jgi:hypothetical protein
VLQSIFDIISIVRWDIERWYAIHMLAIDPQYLSACHEKGRAGTYAHYCVCQCSCVLDDMFAIVEQQKKLSSSDTSSNGYRGDFISA